MLQRLTILISSSSWRRRFRRLDDSILLNEYRRWDKLASYESVPRGALRKTTRRVFPVPRGKKSYRQVVAREKAQIAEVEIARRIELASADLKSELKEPRIRAARCLAEFGGLLADSSIIALVAAPKVQGDESVRKALLESAIKAIESRVIRTVAGTRVKAFGEIVGEVELCEIDDPLVFEYLSRQFDPVDHKRSEPILQRIASQSDLRVESYLIDQARSARTSMLRAFALNALRSRSVTAAADVENELEMHYIDAAKLAGSRFSRAEALSELRSLNPAKADDLEIVMGIQHASPVTQSAIVKALEQIRTIRDANRSWQDRPARREALRVALDSIAKRYAPGLLRPLMARFGFRGHRGAEDHYFCDDLGRAIAAAWGADILEETALVVNDRVNQLEGQVGCVILGALRELKDERAAPILRQMFDWVHWGVGNDARELCNELSSE